MTEIEVEEYEAWLLNPERWQRMTPEERRGQATWLLYYTREGYKRLQQWSDDPDLSAERREKCKRSMEALLCREEKILGLGYTDEETYARAVSLVEEARRLNKQLINKFPTFYRTCI